MQMVSKQNSQWSIQWCAWLVMPAVVLLTCVMIAPVGAQTRKQEKADEKLAVIRGQIAYDKVRVKSWDNNSLVIPYNEIEAKLRQKIILPRPPYPAGYKKWTRKKIIEWEMEFVKTCLLYTSPSPRDQRGSRMPSSA